MIDGKSYIVVAYYTENTFYEKTAEVLQHSLIRSDVPHHIVGVPNLGSWQANTSYKPTFIKNMMCMFAELDIVYVDVDAEFICYPELFDTLGSTMKTNVSVYVFDRSCYRRSKGGTEVLSGTIYIRNNKEALKTVEAWEDRAKHFKGEWDQKSLEFVLKGDFDLLPGEYCKIFDRMDEVAHPVIVH